MIYLFSVCTASLLASSSVEACTESVNGLQCKQKLVLLVDLQAAQDKNAERYVFKLASTDDGLTFEKPVVVCLDKSKVYYEYPTTYLKDFPLYAYESVVNTGQYSCYDNISNDNPTCGWQYDPSGAKIAYSQGFCCACTLFGVQTVNMRGTECSFFSVFTPNTASAHCLNMNTWINFHGYSLQAPTKAFDIAVQVNLLNDTNQYQLQPILWLSETVTQARNSMIQATYLGDLSPPQVPPTMENKILLLPFSGPFDNSFELLVEREMVSLDGSQCNKIGTSYAAFNTAQANQCYQPQGTCLGGQIKDYRQQDIDAYKAGQPGQYMLPLLGMSMQNGVLSKASGIMHTSLIRLEIAADGLQIRTSVARGAIDQVVMNGTSAQVNVANIDTITAKFFLVFTECQPLTLTIQPAASIQFTQKNLTSQIYNFTFMPATTTLTQYNCTLVLQNALGDKLDSKQVIFFAKQVQTMAQNAQLLSSSDTLTTNSTIVQGACSHCTGFTDVGCIFINQCWTQIGILVGVLLLVCVLGYLTIGYCLPCKILRCCFRMSCCCIKCSQKGVKSMENAIDTGKRKRQAIKEKFLNWKGKLKERQAPLEPVSVQVEEQPTSITQIEQVLEALEADDQI